ncbi:MAG: S9 family peptidase [Chloroflexota bacterium]|nr:S9 family peptidase [Chloroflexota bacterium]MDE2910145.1 S9 family peptidase [Chloroflexota bacterium]
MTFESSSEITALIVSLARIGRCWSPSFAPDGDELAFISDLTGKPQVWRMPAAGGFPSAVTAFDEQVSLVIWSPDGRWLAVESAPGGGMNSQIDIVRPDGSDRRRLTAGGSSNNWLGAWTKDGRSLLYSSNQESADTMECFRITLDTGATEKLTSAGGTTVIEDSSADGARLLIKRVAYRGDNNLYLLETSSGGERLLTAHDPPASFENARFSHDERAVFAISNQDTDMACLCRLSLAPGSKWEIARARADAELAEFALSRHGGLAALVWNIAGQNELELVALANEMEGQLIELPGEIIESLRFSPDGSTLALCLSGARAPQDIWRLNIDSCGTRQLTRSPHVGVNLEQLVGARLLKYRAHDDLPLSGWHYTPRLGDAPYPTVLSFHGGPEGQEQPRFRYDYQALLAQGIAVFAPNVRGSSGFGLRFVNLDNGALRFHAIQDIATTAQFLVESGFADPGRLGIMGGSYGGYMTMAGLAHYPDLFAAGVNLYGVVNFKTFFELTEPWMASVSKIEYGDPETEGCLLEALSPIHKLDRVRAPTLVLHGANDTNVPVHEAEQVVAALRARDVPVEYILFPDEGHGFTNERNRITAAAAIVNWFAKTL